MKSRLFFLMPAVFFTTYLFAQVKAVKPLTQKTVVTTPETKKITNPQPVKTQNNPAPAPTDLQKAVVNIVVGDDGKDKDTYVSIDIKDNNQRRAAYYGTLLVSDNINGITTGEFFPGDDETLPTQLQASEPTGQIDNTKVPPLPVIREASVSDFTNGGGSLSITIRPNGHDTWKIKNFSVTLYFRNDPASPHKITWNGFTLSQDSRLKTLEFDKNFNAIQ
ncbi:MAG: hypothetical protein ACHQF0_05560 [Chitinophagales bacterium]